MPVNELKKNHKDGANAKGSVLIHLSSLLGSPILDAAGHSLGRVREVAVTPGGARLAGDGDDLGAKGCTCKRFRRPVWTRRRTADYGCVGMHVPGRSA